MDKNAIPLYDLGAFKHVHRQPTQSVFGYNNLEEHKRILGFEIYSSEGLVSSVGPLRSAFYRLSICITGRLDMNIGLEAYTVQERTISVTYPNQLFAKNNIRADTFGYYILFSPEFLNEFILPVRMGETFSFFALDNYPVFQLDPQEIQPIVQLIEQIDAELRRNETGKEKAIKMYLYLLLLEAKRGYERQNQHQINQLETSSLVRRFLKLVSLHYLTKRQISDYADMLAVTANHLNRTVKAVTGKTASETIKGMLLLESMSLLKHTDLTIAEIAYQLDFSDPAGFSRFFKASTKITPLAYRSNASSGQ